MSKLLIFICVSFVCASVEAQTNLVRNPGFEKYSQCPNAFNQISFADYWSSIDSDNVAGPCIPEYCNECSLFGSTDIPMNGFFYQYAHNGLGVASVQVFYDESTLPAPYNLYRDYLHGRLYHTLLAGVNYCVTFYISLADKSNYGINRIGAYLDDGSIDTATNCGVPQDGYVPQVSYLGGVVTDTMNWIKVEGSFTASGTERFITLGNFYDKANTSFIDIRPNCQMVCHYSWILIDDVSVIESDLNAFAGNDTTIYQGDSVFIGRTPEIGLECKWYVNGSVIDSGAGFWAHPTTTTTYVVEQVLCGLVKTDTVTVTVLPVGIASLGYDRSVSIYPNPATTELIIKMTGVSARSCTITNSIGQQLSVYQLSSRENQIDVSSLPSGVYYLKLEGDSFREVRRFVKL